jgi:serine/threonine protein kinase
VPLTPGARLGRYEVIAPLGSGGMGEVYRARDTRLERDVAIKILPESVARDPDRLARFDREAKSVAALSHPNILALHDAGTEDGMSFAVMELLEGETLRARIAHGALTVRRSVDTAIQIARGLAAAHAKGLVHRDLKPENVFLVADGQVKILDFGLAKATAPALASDADATATDVAMTDPGTVLGTVGYMAPEQVRGHDVDGRSDLFALGTLLFEMVTGQRAFRRDTAAETLTAILREDPPDLPAPTLAQAPALDHIIRHCLEKNASERFQSARDVVFALEAMSRLEHGSTPSGGPSPSDRRPAETGVSAFPTAPAKTRRGLLIAGVAGVLVIVAAYGGWTLTRGGSAGQINKIGVLPIEDISGKDQEFVAGMHDTLTNALSRLGQAGVESRSTMMRYQGGAKTTREVAKELALDAVVEMTVFRAGEIMRINVQFTDPVTSRSLWSDTYEQNVKDVLAAQGEVVGKIAKGIGNAIPSRK